MTVYSEDARKWVNTAKRASSAHLSDSLELDAKLVLCFVLQKRIYSPVTNGMCVAQNVAFEEISVHFDEALWVDCTAHVVNVSLPRMFQARKISSSESVQYPGQLIFYRAIRI